MDKLEKEILKRASYMNNSKWFRLLTEMQDAEINIHSAYIKFLLNDRKYKFHLGGFNEKGFGDVSELGPFRFKEIEWILIPERYETERWNRNEKLTSEFFFQPIEKIEQIIKNMGLLEYEIREEGLRIFGYK